MCFLFPLLINLDFRTLDSFGTKTPLKNTNVFKEPVPSLLNRDTIVSYVTSGKARLIFAPAVIHCDPRIFVRGKSELMRLKVFLEVEDKTLCYFQGGGGPEDDASVNP